MTPNEIEERRAKARRNAWILGFVALCFFFGFIAMSVVRSQH